MHIEDLYHRLPPLHYPISRTIIPTLIFIFIFSIQTLHPLELSTLSSGTKALGVCARSLARSPIHDHHDDQALVDAERPQQHRAEHSKAQPQPSCPLIIITRRRQR